MAATPPSQIVGTPDTPLTPLHGAAYDRSNSRRGARSSARIASRESRSTPDASLRNEVDDPAVTLTPKSSRKSAARSSHVLHSPQLTPKNKSTRRVQVTSPPSPDTHTSPRKQSSASKSHLQPFASSSTTISDGMLPTPVKTPKKKMVSKVNGTARALFQDPVQTITEPSSKKARKNRRYNGFSLESFSTGDDETKGNIQIFTDSRDRVPDLDNSKANPFVEKTMDDGEPSSQKVPKTAKRRKVSVEKNLDPQVEEAIANDEGMVYVL